MKLSYLDITRKKKIFHLATKEFRWGQHFKLFLRLSLPSLSLCLHSPFYFKKVPVH